MARFRYRTGDRVGRWQQTRRAAQLAAADAGLGTVDDFSAGPDQPARIYLHPLVEIEEAPDA